LYAVKKLPNVRLMPHTTMVDLLFDEGKTQCLGALVRDNRTGELTAVLAGNTVLATGGVGGLFRHSTNFRILTGDGVGVALEHGIAVDHPDYVQFHPTTLYTQRRGRSFLISESVRGEGAQLINAAGERFVDELLPRDVVTAAIRKEMRKEGSKFVRLDLRTVAGGEETLLHHFPGIVERCREEGYDVLSEPIPVVPAQHYFMGGVRSDLSGRTTMPHLYAVGETCCNGVHGRNRLASNSLLEALIFARRAADDIAKGACARGQAVIPSMTYDKKQERARHALVTKEVDREHE
ncbi:MAG TPA: FAD-binding protein, partial [Candidatus Gallimonas intestinigallinarum]|nr:FAD-binding protein [Candidatus Gallimonas intestinigallinarum]